MTNAVPDTPDLDVGQGGWSIDDFLSDFRPPEQVVHLTARGDLLGRHSDLKVQLDGARQLQSDGLDDDGHTVELAEELEKIEEELRRSLRAFTVRAIGDEAWSDLVAAHPPTEKQKEENRFAWVNHDTFWQHAIAASVSQPPVSAAAAEKMAQQIDSGQMQKLRNAVLEVNGGGADIPKSGASSVLRGDSKRNSRTASL